MSAPSESSDAVAATVAAAAAREALAVIAAAAAREALPVVAVAAATREALPVVADSVDFERALESPSESSFASAARKALEAVALKRGADAFDSVDFERL